MCNTVCHDIVWDIWNIYGTISYCCNSGPKWLFGTLSTKHNHNNNNKMSIIGFLKNKKDQAGILVTFQLVGQFCFSRISMNYSNGLISKHQLLLWSIQSDQMYWVLQLSSLADEPVVCSGGVLENIIFKCV